MSCIYLLGGKSDANKFQIFVYTWGKGWKGGVVVGIPGKLPCEIPGKGREELRPGPRPRRAALLVC